MPKKHLFFGTFVVTGFGAVVATLLLSIPEQTPASADQITARAFLPPLPHVPTPASSVPLSAVEQLGKAILFDDTLSNPPGYSCAQCHAPSTGYRTGLSSLVNAVAGPQPGVVPGRSGSRTPQSYAYAAFSPVGPFFDGEFAGAWVGGGFWDGRVPDLSTQARQPFLAPVEMANLPTNGIFPPHAGGYSALVVQKVANRPYAALFRKIYGPNVFRKYSTPELYTLITEAIAAFESSGDICQFSSRYDASVHGVPRQNKYILTASEERGRALFFGKATCFGCHSSSMDPPVLATTQGKDTFTMFLFQNVGVPRNYNNPIYQETDCASNPQGCNPMGTHFVDYGLGANPNPAPNGARFFHSNPGDIPQFRGLFQAPTLRNVDKRPTPNFVKAYMHNGCFKSLNQVVHFYNRRNFAVNSRGQQVAFDLRHGAPSGFTPLFAPPEVLDNVVNVQGAPGAIGNLGLSAQQELDIVAFLSTLTDGFTRPNPVRGR